MKGFGVLLTIAAAAGIAFLIVKKLRGQSDTGDTADLGTDSTGTDSTDTGGTLDSFTVTVTDAVDAVTTKASDLVGTLMGRLTPSQIAGFAQNAGFSGQDLITAVSIAMAESSGNPMAHGDQSLGSGRGSFGLWQIYSDAHPEFGPDFTTLYDPQRNANAAFSVYRAAGNSFRPWSTFNGGQYTAYVQRVASALNG